MKLRSIGHLLVLSVFAFGMGSALAQDQNNQQEVFAPIVFDRDNGATLFAPDIRLDIATVGTIEIGLTIPEDPNDFFPQVMTLFTHGSASETRMRVQIGGRGTMLGLDNGDLAETLNYDFRGGGFFQIGFSTREDRTQVFINGELVGTLPLGFGTALDVPLYVGGQPSGYESFLGDIHYIRFWDIDLTRTDLSKTAAFYSRPTGIGPIETFLVAHSRFTNLDQSITYARDISDNQFVSAGEIGTPSGTSFTLLVPENSGVVELSGTWAKALDELQMTVKDNDGNNFVRRVAGSGDPQQGKMTCDDTGLTCTANAGLASAVSYGFQEPQVLDSFTLIESSDGRVKGVALGDGVAEDGFLIGTAEPQDRLVNVTLSPGMRFAGFFGTVGEHVNSLGIYYRVNPPFRDIRGTWTFNSSFPPRKASLADTGTALHGNYSEEAVFVLDASSGGQIITVRGPSVPQEQVFSLVRADGVYTRISPSPAITLEFLDDETLLFDGVRMTKTAPYPRISVEDRSFNEFGGTFNLEHQVPFTEHMFRGHDIVYIDPENLQDSRPVRRPVFLMPGADSLNFTTSYRKIIPFGLHHIPDFRERSTKDLRSIASASEYSTEMSRTIGGSIGIPKVFSFKASVEVRNRMDQQASSKSQFSIHKDVRTQNALVLDKRHMQLDPYFRARVRDLERAVKLGQPVDVSTFLMEFGTHYPFAMTVGTVSVDTVQYSNSAYKELYDKGQTLDAHASGVIRGVELGADYKSDSNMSDSFNKEMEQQHEVLQGVGSETQPVPVFLDLRPLSELLAPPFFTEPTITRNLRFQVQRGITNYTSQFAGLNRRPADIWEPYFFKVAFVSAIGGTVPDDPAKPIVGVPVTAIAGDFFVIGPDDVRTNVKRLLRTNPQPATRAFNFASSDEQEFMVTASQLCGSDGQKVAVVAVGTDLALDFSRNGDGSNLVASDVQADFVFLRDLTAAPVTKTMTISSEAANPGAAIVTYMAQRLPDIDGGFKEMPICP